RAPPARETAAATIPSGMYSPGMSILLLGEADFSFAAALALMWGDATNITATSLDAEPIALNKYSSASDNVESVRSLGGRVEFGVDATRLRAHAGVRKREGYDRIVFNFPHVGSGVKDQASNVLCNPFS
ncbi:MAG: hypothetical protein SGPRY_007027, partial [Prymnesium sp.]